MATDLTVIIPTHRRPELLRRTLESLATCEKPGIYRETVVVENGSRAGGGQAIAQDFTEALGARYLFVERGNKSHALNEALATLEGSGKDGAHLAVFFDDDVRFAPGALMAYAEAAEGVEGGVMYGGPFGVDYEEAPSTWLLPYLPDSALGRNADDWRLGRDDFNGFLGFNWAAFVQDVATCGGFDEHFGPGSGAMGQEGIMQSMLLHAGTQPRLVLEAKVWHYVPRERSSTDWLLGRQERAGRRKARDQIDQFSASPSLAKTVFVLVNRAARIAKRGPLALWHKITGDERERFRQRYYLNYHSGVAQEMWRHLARKLKRGNFG